MSIGDLIIKFFDAIKRKPDAPSAIQPAAPVVSPPPVLVAVAPAPIPAPAPVPVVVAPAASPVKAMRSVGITQSHLTRMGASQANAALYCDWINEACFRMEINTNARVCGFIAQVFEETGGLARTTENLNYTAQNLHDTFEGRYPTVDSARALAAGGPEAVANALYGRPDMGNTQPGDGWKYRGRGFIQLTFKNNYIAAGKYLGIDLVNHPDRALEPEIMALTSAWFWRFGNGDCNPCADLDSERGVEMATQHVNGGQNNIKVRKEYWRKAKAVFADIK